MNVHLSTSMHFTDGRSKGADPADVVYVFDCKKEAQDYAAACEGWRKKKVLTRTIRVAHRSFDAHCVCLWMQRR